MKRDTSLVGIVLLLGCSVSLFAQASKHESAASPLDKSRLEQVMAA